VKFNRTQNQPTVTFINGRAIALALIAGLFGLVWCGASSRAQVKRQPRPKSHISDVAEVLDSTTKARIEKVLDKLKERTDIEFVVATIKDTGQESLYDYSLRLANDWNVGSMASPNKSLLVLITTDSGKLFTQVSKSARASLPDGLIGEMGLRIRSKVESLGYSQGVLAGIQTFVNGVGELRSFTFADLDTENDQQIARQQRRRVVGTPAPEVVETPATTPSPQPTETPSRRPIATATPEITPAATPTPEATPAATPTPEATPVANPTPEVTSTRTRVVETPPPTPSPEPSTTPAPLPQPSETRAPVVPVPSGSPSPTPLTTDSTPTPTRKTKTSPEATTQAKNSSARPAKSPTPDSKADATATPDPEDEKEEVELTLTKPVDKRIDLLKAFILAHPQSVAVPRAYELIVAAHATLGDQKLKSGDTDGGLQEFRLAMSEAPADMSDRLFTEVIARIPVNLFLRGQREAANEVAHQAEALAKLNSARLLALAEYYMTIEDAGEANRIAELAVQNAPDSAAAHQALGAARHIALRLDEAASEYARALSIDPKSKIARIALADLNRAGGKSEAALALYREQLLVEPNSKSAHAGLVLSLLELGKKTEAAQELSTLLDDKEQARNLPLLVGAAYWFVGHGDTARALDLAQKAVAIEPRYSWAQIALARALIAEGHPLDGERALRFARQYSRFPTLDYELASMLVSVGLYDEAIAELTRSFSFNDGQIETRLAGRTAARAASFIDLLAPERRAAIFQASAADTEANAKMLKGLLALNTALRRSSVNEDEVLNVAQDFIGGDDPMRTYRLIYVAARFVRGRVGLSTVVDLMEKASSGVETALSVSGATLAVQPEELSDIRARALAQGGIPDVPTAPRAALSGILRGRIEDLAGLALFNLDKSEDALAHLRRAVSVSPPGTPLSRSAMWHLGSALEAGDKSDQALLYYIKSYVSGPPDPARRAVIEKVYKKVNGSLEGLDDKIGPAGAAANVAPTATPVASPAPTPKPQP
jgi:tetratricopeptide (TPR) repeat protein